MWQMGVDTSRGEHLRITMNITLPALPCAGQTLWRCLHLLLIIQPVSELHSILSLQPLLLQPSVWMQLIFLALMVMTTLSA